MRFSEMGNHFMDFHALRIDQKLGIHAKRNREDRGERSSLFVERLQKFLAGLRS